MEKVNVVFLTRVFLLSFVFSFSPVIAGQWKPLCIEGSSCNAPYQVVLGGGWQGYNPIDSYAAGPLVTSEGILLHHTPNKFPIFNLSNPSVRHIFQLSSSGQKNFGGGFHYVSDVNAIQSPAGQIFSFWLGGALAWFTLDADKETIDWFGLPGIYLNNAALTGSPIIVNDVMYIGVRGGGAQSIYMSTDDGNSWSHHVANIRIGETRFNLLENPERNALWAIQEEFFFFPGSLWESVDHGATWRQVDDGSFPPQTVRVIHDPENSNISYSLTRSGLFVSGDRGVSWQATSLTKAVHGMVFVERNEPLSRALIVGTDSGVRVSVDEAVSWIDMSAGLLAIPHTVTYGHDMLLATSDAGYFTCNSVDCAGLSQPLPPEKENGIVEVIEFYNTKLDHYFITASQADIDFIDQGLAGNGWTHTGESFLAWSLGSNVEAANVCRFYGSYYPGPNSHFFSVSTQDCSFLMTLQETRPATKPRWNFEEYAFSIMPPIQGRQEPCSENFVPVYRAYNNGYSKGEDSNHRYVTNLGLLAPLIEKGWSNEGVVFCSPIE